MWLNAKVLVTVNSNFHSGKKKKNYLYKWCHFCSNVFNDRETVTVNIKNKFLKQKGKTKNVYQITWQFPKK